MMQVLVQYVVERVREERGAELVEWIIWVGALVGVGAVAAAGLGGGLAGAVGNILGAIPGAGGGS